MSENDLNINEEKDANLLIQNNNDDTGNYNEHQNHLNNTSNENVNNQPPQFLNAENIPIQYNPEEIEYTNNNNGNCESPLQKEKVNNPIQPDQDEIQINNNINPSEENYNQPLINNQII